MKMKGLNIILIYIPYFKKKKCNPSRIPRRKHLDQYVRTTNEKYDNKEKNARKLNQKKVSYHSVGTQQLGKRPKKT
jgi:hypothetical protein